MRDEVRHEAQISLSGLDKEVTLVILATRDKARYDAYISESGRQQITLVILTEIHCRGKRRPGYSSARRTVRDRLSTEETEALHGCS